MIKPRHRNNGHGARNDDGLDNGPLKTITKALGPRSTAMTTSQTHALGSVLGALKGTNLEKRRRLARLALECDRRRCERFAILCEMSTLLIEKERSGPHDGEALQKMISAASNESTKVCHDISLLERRMSLIEKEMLTGHGSANASSHTPGGVPEPGHPLPREQRDADLMAVLSTAECGVCNRLLMANEGETSGVMVCHRRCGHSFHAGCEAQALQQPLRRASVLTVNEIEDWNAANPDERLRMGELYVVQRCPKCGSFERPCLHDSSDAQPFLDDTKG
jgi:hypothetical protein